MNLKAYLGMHSHFVGISQGEELREELLKVNKKQVVARLVEGRVIADKVKQ